jgi:hypothetical protein
VSSPGPQGEAAQLRVIARFNDDLQTDENVMQFRYPTQEPVEWTDLYVMPDGETPPVPIGNIVVGSGGGIKDSGVALEDIEDAIKAIPEAGLKPPIGIELESQLSELHPALTADNVGLFYIIQTMDITAPGKTGKAWANYEDGDDTKPVIWYKTYDQYYALHGLTG